MRTGGARRDKQGNLTVPYKWYELQVDYYNSGTYKQFMRDKIVWAHMSPEARFSYVSDGTYCNQKAFILTGASLKYLCAILNSPLITWYMKQNAVTTGMGLMQWDKFSVERIPVPKIDSIQQLPFINLLNMLLSSSYGNLKAKHNEIDSTISQSAYTLYQMNKSEVEFVEDASSSV